MSPEAQSHRRRKPRYARIDPMAPWWWVIKQARREERRRRLRSLIEWVWLGALIWIIVHLSRQLWPK